MPNPDPVIPENLPPAPVSGSSSDAVPGGVVVPDHQLIRRVGKGGYGEVWLARNMMGTYRGVKLIYRSNFDNDRPFERELAGIERYEPISRTHPGLMSILHIGGSLERGYFYYVMEVADDAVSGRTIYPEVYDPKTLSRELARRGRLPFGECLNIVLILTAALAHLHSHSLLHRDLKPSNIVFIDGVPKLADIGLVARMGEPATFVGTEGYIPPEGPGSPMADIYSLGKVIYEMSLGKDRHHFPELPSDLYHCKDADPLMRLNEVVLKACDRDPARRYQSAAEMYEAVSSLQSPQMLAPPPATSSSPPATSTTTRRIAILFKSNLQPDGYVSNMLQEQLAHHDCRIFVDRDLLTGVELMQKIEANLRQSDAVIAVLSEQSSQSEMIAYEMEMVREAALEQHGKPRLFSVLVCLTEPLPEPVAAWAAGAPRFHWEGPQDDEPVCTQLLAALDATPTTGLRRPVLESVGGAVPLDSAYYVERPTDLDFQAAIGRRDGIVLLKGARQMGKTSLLARGLQQARRQGSRVVLTDFQKLHAGHLTSIDRFFMALGEYLADQLELDSLPQDVWDKRRSPNTNFERFLRREVLGKLPAPLVWGLDEVDRLFHCSFASEVFGLFRSWHNERALDPSGPWSRLTLAMAYATEAHLFITDINQSPFNVGTRLVLEDFSVEELAELNRRYENPLHGASNIQQLHDLVGGQPYLCRSALNRLATGSVSFSELMAEADRDEGLFGDHLRRMLLLLAKDPQLTQAVREILQGKGPVSTEHFYRLRSAGVMTGDSQTDVRPRCRLYASYLRRHLL